jgi:hypothetical protein
VDIFRYLITVSGQSMFAPPQHFVYRLHDSSSCRLSNQVTLAVVVDACLGDPVCLKTKSGPPSL